MRSARNKIILNGAPGRQKKDSLSLILAIIFFFASISVLLIGIAMGSYTNVTKTCISCHNDTGIPFTDTDLNGVAAPFKRPHNNTIMCELCHGSNPHNLTY
ncbi:MAG: hypothetical protein O8C60_01785, partial [Candidatus Methanoperedens sp.]|nr:hypothetical protein [Candidatus Methanoperedens sp.]